MYKRLAGPLLIIFVAILPVILFLAFSPVNISSSDLNSGIFDLLARFTALGAISLLSLNIILSARLRIFDRLFLGMDRAYRFHRTIGGVVLILVLVHAMLVTTKYSNISLLSGYEFLKPNFDIAMMLGKLSAAGMLIAVFISMYIKIRYEWFIIIQRLLGAVIFFGGYHALFVSGTDLQTNIALLVYFIFIGGIASGLYIYRSLMHKTVQRQLMYTVESVTVSEGVSRIWLIPVGKSLAFYAGQFAFFSFNSSAVDIESHPFSISSGSDDSRLRIAVKASGDYTAAIQNVSVGDSVSVDGPYGAFSFTKKQSTKQVWIAGGIGITPFLSMAQSLPAGYEVTLFYGTKKMAEANIFMEELNLVSLKNPGFKVVLVCDEQGQRISVDMLRQVPAVDYLICAPLPMMKSLEEQLVYSGISCSNIHYEEFRLR